jgi:hypothetical protein
MPTGREKLMPEIKRRYVKNAKKEHECDSCFSKINTGDPYIYLFGMAHYSEKPYALHICDECDYERTKYHEDIKTNGN